MKEGKKAHTSQGGGRSALEKGRLTPNTHWWKVKKLQPGRNFRLGREESNTRHTSPKQNHPDRMITTN